MLVTQTDEFFIPKDRWSILLSTETMRDKDIVNVCCVLLHSLNVWVSLLYLRKTDICQC